MSDKKIAKIYYDAHVFLTKTGELYGYTIQSNGKPRCDVFRSFCASSHVSASTMASWVFSKISQSSLGFITAFLSL